jgi:hypothetical protein
MRPLRPPVEQLLAGFIDYAGLFPPAALAMADAVRNYAAYASGPTAWILGRFVVPARRLEEFGVCYEALRPAERGPGCWVLSGILGPDPAGDLELVRRYNQGPMGDRAPVVAVEGAAATPEEVRRLAALAPRGVRLAIELPRGGPLAELVQAVGEVGALAKARTGGTRPEDIPDTEAVLAFLGACAARRQPCKVTAGLHHPVRRMAPLTYEPGSAGARMFGYLNLLLAAAALWHGRPAEARGLLEEEDASRLAVTENRLVWGHRAFSVEELRTTRREFVRAMGSCSFTEPVEELEALGVALASPGVPA